MLSYEDINGFWDIWHDWKKRPSLYNLRVAHKLIKQMWDGQDAPDSMDMSETLLSDIKRSFPRDSVASSGRPLGAFRDIMEPGITHEEVFNILNSKLKRLRPGKDGRRTSFLKNGWKQADKLFRKHFSETKYGKSIDASWSPELYRDAMILMMYSSTIGIVLEQRAHEDLAEWLNGHEKAAKIFSYEPAPNRLESEDVDGVFRNRKTGEIVVKVSVKSVGAFTEDWINRGYRDKGKTKPDIYAGYRSVEDDEISFIEIGGKSLKDLLKESL